MIYSIDLDGTLCTQEKDYSKARPYRDRIAYVNALYEAHTIIIDTARGYITGNRLRWRYITMRQLKEWGVKYHELRVGKKLDADFFVDDKSINAKDFFKDT